MESFNRYVTEIMSRVPSALGEQVLDPVSRAREKHRSSEHYDPRKHRPPRSGPL